MKVLGIMGSSRRDGNTNDLLEAALRGAAEVGAAVENLCLLDYSLHHIYNCRECMERGECPPDDFPQLRDKIFEADGLIWGSPVYWYTMSGLMKVLWDRLCCALYLNSQSYFEDRFRGKVSAIITVQEEQGVSRAQPLLSCLEMNFEYCKMEYLGYVLGPGGPRGTVLRDGGVVQKAYELGKRVVLFKSVSLPG